MISRKLEGTQSPRPILS
ncbi:hypothetical protein LINPERPRIM_LOCUS9951 [Linum perenne]